MWEICQWGEFVNRDDFPGLSNVSRCPWVGCKLLFPHVFHFCYFPGVVFYSFISPSFVSRFCGCGHAVISLM